MDTKPLADRGKYLRTLVTPKLRKGEKKITATPQMTSEFSYPVPPPPNHLFSSGNTKNVEGLQVSKEEHSK